MNTLTVSFIIPEKIQAGLANGIYERVGGVIRKTGTKRVVTWLREGIEKFDPVATNLMGLSSVGAVSSILNLAITTMGFIIVQKRLGAIEHNLELAQEVLKSIDYKIDLSFYANFRAALDLAMNAFTMTNSETRKLSAMQAINRFLEAEHHYTKLTDLEISNGSQVADEYLSTLCLAYITEVRCYLELEEIDTAHRRLQEGAAIIRSRYEKHINTLLTSNPAAYLHPSLKDQVELRRLTNIYQWLDPGLDENSVFELQRENIFRLAQNPKEWMDTLPQAIRISKGGPTSAKTVLNDFAKQSKKFITELPAKTKKKDGSQATETVSPESEVFGRLPSMMSLMETLIEDDNRLTMYESEVGMIHQLGMSFQEWKQLTPPSTEQSIERELVCITVE